MKHFAFLLLISLSSCSGAKVQAPALNPNMSIDFSAIDVESSRPVTLSHSLGKLTLVHIWATWCPQCLMELGGLKQLDDQIGGQNFKIIAVALNSDPDRIREIKKNSGIKFTIWNDPTGHSEKAIKPQSLPFSILVDRSGRPVAFLDPETKHLVTSTTGPRSWGLPQVVESFKQILNK